MADKSKKSSEKVAEYENLKKTFIELEKDEKSIKEYLNTNVFDYAQNSQHLEDIFAIKNFSLNFFEQTKDCPKINPNVPIIEVSHLTKYYASRNVPSLINVTVKVYLGDIHVVVGSNGSGKTTLFNCLRGVEDYEGDILLDGRCLSTADSSFDPYKIMSFVPVESGWEAYSTTEQVIMDVFNEKGLTEIEAQNYIRSSLDQLGIAYLRYYNTIDLTLLEKKKLQIAISLIDDPSVIVIDELFLGLQPHECLDLLVILTKLRNDNRAILAFSHSFNDFAKFANTISIISEGRIYYTGLIENLFLTQQNKYAIVTLDNKAALSLIKDMNLSYEYNELIDTIYVNFGGKLNLLSFQQECAKNSLIIHEIKPIETSLNDLYPILIKEGNKEAIKDINTISFFTPPNDH